MRWTASPTPGLLDAVEARLHGLAWSAVPEGWERVGPLRSMRQVLRGTLPEATGPAATGPGAAGPGFGGPVVVKRSRAVTIADAVSRRWRGGKGPREGRVLRALAAEGVAVPRVLAYADDTEDLLVTEDIPDLAPLPDAAAASPAQVSAVAALLGRAWRAGLRHRDLHRGNLALAGGAPVLVDAGSARIGGPEASTLALARALSGMGGGLSLTQRRRALAAWLEAAGLPVSEERLRREARRIEDLARRVTRAYRRGRDRRARRSGRHFALVETTNGIHGIRRRTVSPALADRAATWLRELPSDAVALKGGDRVVRVRLGETGDVVVKRYGAVTRGRLPRGLRTLRTAVAFENRGVGTPTPHLALAGPDRTSLVVSAYVPTPDLHRFTDGGRGGAYAALSRHERREVCERLGRFLRHLHDQELRHRDLKAPNLLVEKSEHEPWHFLVGDLDGGRRARAEVGWRRRARDLGRLDASLDATVVDRARVLDAYWRVLPRPPITKRTFAVWIATYVAWKRRRRARPR